jgi:cytochrome c-type biogenesis protein CcmF
MATFGTFVLAAAFVVCAYAMAASVAGARRGSRRLVESGVGSFYLLTALMTLASAVLVHAFVTNDYSIKYVQHYSDAVQPMFYKITSYWGGLDGSIMFWVFLLAVFGSTAVYVNRERHRELIPYVVAIMAGVEMFFLFVMIVHKNPFDSFLTQVPADGQGLNPLLQNIYMVVHPPSLYIGFVGMTVPFAFGLAALITGHLDDSWLRAVRRWTMVSWLFLTLGLTLGMIWAYEELGWGGYWAWDPVENAGLLPWFTASAFLHSVIVQERRGMLKVWNVTLVIVTFMLTIFGTFMTRSGVVQSVHAFGEDRALMWMFIVFMVTSLVFGFFWVLYRLPLLKPRHELDSWVSREAAFVANNWILLFAAIFVLFATMFPTLSEALTGNRLTVGPPFFNRWMVPIGLVILVLTGIAPLMAWKKSTVGNLREQFTWPVSIAALTAGVLIALGMHRVAPVTCFALCAFVSTSIIQEFVRGAGVRKDATGSDIFTALIGLVMRERRRYGGYIVHLGIVLMFIGFAGEAFKTEQQFALKPGQQASLRHFSVRNDGVRVTDDGQKQMVTGQIAVFEDGKSIGTMSPARWFYRKHEEQPTTEVAIRRGLTEDLYIVMPAYELQDQSITVQVVINPLVNWIWMGFTILVLGTGICLLPERTFAFAVSRIPAGAATTPLVLLLGVALLSPQVVQGASSARHRGESATRLQVADMIDRETRG